MKFLEKVSYNCWYGVSFLIVLSCGLTTVAIADTETDTKTETTILFQPPREESKPEKTEGAASRNNRVCSQDIATQNLVSQSQRQSSLTAIVPHSNYGLTVAERPTFWVSLPTTSAKKVILTLKEKGRNPHWQQLANLNEKAGIVGIKLANEAPALEVDKEYQWTVILVCGNKPHPNDPVVTAKIKRVEIQVVRDSSFDNYTALERANVYAIEGIWHDTLDILIAEKSSLTDWNNLWVNYLQSAGLAELSDEPIVDRLAEE